MASLIRMFAIRVKSTQLLDRWPQEVRRARRGSAGAALVRIWHMSSRAEIPSSDPIVPWYPRSQSPSLTLPTVQSYSSLSNLYCSSSVPSHSMRPSCKARNNCYADYSVSVLVSDHGQGD